MRIPSQSCAPHTVGMRRLALQSLLILLCAAVSSCSGTSPSSGAANDQVATVEEAVQAPPQSTPWLVVLCKASDYQTVPAGLDVGFFRRLFATRGTGGLLDYWRDQSYGNVDLTGSVVTDWATGPNPSYIASDGNRWIAARPPNSPGSITGQQVIQDCINTQQGKQDFSKFYNVIALYNVLVGTQGGIGAVVGGKTFPAAVKVDVGTAGMTVLAHEMGHGYTLGHSFVAVVRENIAIHMTS